MALVKKCAAALMAASVPAILRRIATGGHAPVQYRALSARNLYVWYAAFGMKPGDTLYLSSEQSVEIC